MSPPSFRLIEYYTGEKSHPFMRNKLTDTHPSRMLLSQVELWSTATINNLNGRSGQNRTHKLINLDFGVKEGLSRHVTSQEVMSRYVICHARACMPVGYRFVLLYSSFTMLKSSCQL
jgi:hypothetical protein